MTDLQPGDRVRLTRAARRWMFWARLQYGNGTQGKGWAMRQHVREFRRCVGIVQGPTDFNNVGPEHPDYDPEKVDPLVLDVRWLPHGLRYMYHADDLEKVP